jgi:RIO kinase 1
MKIPKRLEPLVHEGLIDEVLGSLKSGKEAAVYVVRADGVVRCAKVYKAVDQRGFHKQSLYREGRQVRNSRQARAMAKGSRYGRQEQEDVWQNTEVDALYRLAAAGVRVPQPYNFIDGVLLMELITDADGEVAPRLNDLELTPEQARAYHASLIADVVRMLGIGLVHGDLSEFNILVDAQGPVIIDLPQAVDAAANNHAPWMLKRDVANLAAYFGQFAPELLTTSYGEEIWHLYEHGHLTPEVSLTGHFKGQHRTVDLDSILSEIHDAEEEAQRRRQARDIDPLDVEPFPHEQAHQSPNPLL